MRSLTILLLAVGAMLPWARTAVADDVRTTTTETYDPVTGERRTEVTRERTLDTARDVRVQITREPVIIEETFPSHPYDGQKVWVHGRRWEYDADDHRWELDDD